ncbi:MAG: phosphopantetheine-binding protein, partial [Clostridiales bacterium]|nr:phosphopantetheine-binding protein [Clostridiales bacterium]
IVDPIVFLTPKKRELIKSAITDMDMGLGAAADAGAGVGVGISSEIVAGANAGLSAAADAGVSSEIGASANADSGAGAAGAARQEAVPGLSRVSPQSAAYVEEPAFDRTELNNAAPRSAGDGHGGGGGLRDSLFEVALESQRLNNKALESFFSSQGNQMNALLEIMRCSGNKSSDVSGISAEGAAKFVETFQTNSMKAYEAYINAQRAITSGNGTDVADVADTAALRPDAASPAVSPPPVGPEPNAATSAAAGESAAAIAGMGAGGGTHIGAARSMPAPSPQRQPEPNPPSYPPQQLQPPPAAVEISPPAGYGDPGGESPANVLISLISEKTGYPQDMIDPSMDLESDLGVDSIKRIEIFAELNQKLQGGLNQDMVESLAELHTIDEIGAFLAKRLGGGAAAEYSDGRGNPLEMGAPAAYAVFGDADASSGACAASNADTSSNAYAASAAGAADSYGAGRNPEAVPGMGALSGAVGGGSENFGAKAPAAAANDIGRALINIISDKTGYPEDMIDETMDMESDLGIDSIKRIEVFSELNQFLPNGLGQDDVEALSSLHTIEEVRDLLKKKACDVSSGAAPADTQSDPEIGAIAAAAETSAGAEALAEAKAASAAPADTQSDPEIGAIAAAETSAGAGTWAEAKAASAVRTDAKTAAEAETDFEAEAKVEVEPKAESETEAEAASDSCARMPERAIKRYEVRLSDIGACSDRLNFTIGSNSSLSALDGIGEIGAAGGHGELVIVTCNGDDVSLQFAGILKNMGFHVVSLALPGCGSEDCLSVSEAHYRLPAADDVDTGRVFRDISELDGRRLTGFVHISAINPRYGGSKRGGGENCGGARDLLDAVSARDLDDGGGARDLLNGGGARDLSRGGLFDQTQIDTLKAVFLCAKYFKKYQSPEPGRKFFVSALRMDGHLGLRPGAESRIGGARPGI